MMLKDRLQKQIKEYIDDHQSLKHLNLNRNTEVRFLAQGEYNINFVLDSSTQKYVFRVNTGSQMENENQIKYEYDSIKFLEPSGVTPKVFFVDDSLSFFQYGILIMEFLEGEPLQYEKDLSKAATIFSRIHSLEVKQNHTHFKVENHILVIVLKKGKDFLLTFGKAHMSVGRSKTFLTNF